MQNINFIPIYESRVKNRYVIRFNEKTSLPEFFVRIDNITNIKNCTKDGWYDIFIEFYDAISSSANEGLSSIVHCIKNKELENFDLLLQVVDPVGVVVNKWKLKNCIFTKVKFEDYDFGKLEMNLKFKKAELIKNNEVK